MTQLASIGITTMTAGPDPSGHGWLNVAMAAVLFVLLIALIIEAIREEQRARRAHDSRYDPDNWLP